MRSSRENRRDHFGKRLLLVVAVLCALVSTSVLSRAAISTESSVQPNMTIAVTNNSSFEIRHLYLSPVDRNEWGPDQMDGSALKTGETFTLTDIACTGAEIKVIAEDKDGCFFYGVVSCAQSSAAWTITNELSRDCGGEAGN